MEPMMATGWPALLSGSGLSGSRMGHSHMLPLSSFLPSHSGPVYRQPGKKDKRFTVERAPPLPSKGKLFVSGMARQQHAGIEWHRDCKFMTACGLAAGSLTARQLPTTVYQDGAAFVLYAIAE